MTTQKISFIVGAELLIMLVAFFVAKDVTQFKEIAFMLTCTVLVSAASIYLFRKA